jgi:spore maturation protein CgeB
MLCHPNRIVIVGNPEPVHVGAHLNQAAEGLKLEARLCDSRGAFAGAAWLTKFNWRIRGHRPSKLRKFSDQLFRVCQEFQPMWILSTGLAPIDYRALTAICKLGVRPLNYLTDDPWNPAHQARWFLEALPFYHHVFTTRRSNLDDLRQLGCSKVSYLPFAYAPELHFPEPPTTPEEKTRLAADVVFIGGADLDRVPYMVGLKRAGFKVALYGGYWDRFSETKKISHGHADPRMVRKAIGGAKVALCLVRRANRDGNSMRTFEVPAIGACMLVEDTTEHRDIFGIDKEAVAYFRTIDEMIEKLRWLLANDKERWRLARAAHDLIVNGHNTYLDRLISMFSMDGTMIAS